MKFFLDTANIADIKRLNKVGIIDGVTTNPSLIAKECNKSLEYIINEICDIVDGPISAEVIALDVDNIVKEGRLLSKLHNNVVVKIPLTINGITATKILRADGINTNLTLCFSITQGLMAAKSGATYVSPFVGRLDDVGLVGINLVRDLINVFNMYNFKTQIITASIRNIQHVADAALVGSHIATIPVKVFDQMILHPLTEKGIETFLLDWNKNSL